MKARKGQKTGLLDYFCHQLQLHFFWSLRLKIEKKIGSKKNRFFSTRFSFDRDWPRHRSFLFCLGGPGFEYHQSNYLLQLMLRRSMNAPSRKSLWYHHIHVVSCKEIQIVFKRIPEDFGLHLETSSCKLSCSKQFFNLTQILFDALRLYELRKLELAKHELTS